MGKRGFYPVHASKEENMNGIRKFWTLPMLLAACFLMLVSVGYAQDDGALSLDQLQAKAINVPAGQEMKIDGVILGQQSDNLVLRSLGGGIYKVTLSANTELKEKKSNFFRGAKNYSRSNLIPGLECEVKGTGDSSGAIAAREIKFRNDDLIVAQTMDTRVVPVENELKSTQARLSETEQNAKRLSGQVQELAVVSAEARSGAKTAQESADHAMSAANVAKSAADTAQAGVHAANERITSIDDYEVKNVATVYFKAGSAALSDEDKSELTKFAEQTTNEKGFFIEVAGFASSDGDEAFNRRLSQKRADAVIQFLAEGYSIPLRRFLTPMGYGETRPVADNNTRDGRKENRRVEVRILVSKGLAPAEGSSPSSSVSAGS
jgi:OOP family OmpA-OmpF porin